MTKLSALFRRTDSAGGRRWLGLNRWSGSLTTKMFVLVLIAVMPALAIQSYNEYDLRKSREDDIRNKVIQITKQFGAEMGEIREGVRQYLEVISQLPPVKSFDAEACHRLLATLNARTPYYSLLGVADSTGTVRCASGPTSLTSVADLPFFQRAMAQPDLAVGNYWVDPASGVQQIHFAVRLIGEKGGPILGVVFAGLDLHWLSDHLKERGLTPTQSILIADRAGNIIARLPHPEQLVGKNMRGGHAAIMDGNTEGWEESKGVDGVVRIFGYVPPALPPRDFFLSAGESKAAAFAAIDHVTQRGIFLILVGLLLATYAAWLGGRIFIQRPIQALLQVAAEWRNGNYAARSQFKEQLSEIGRLSAAFNEMAEAVATRHSAQLQAEHRLQELNTTLEERVEERTLELVAANRAKSQFLANMSHEIRTPMNGVSGMLELLRHTKLEPKQQVYVETAQHSADTMLSLITSILDFSKIEAGKFTLETKNFDLHGLMEDVIYTQGTAASEKGLHLSLVTSSNLPTALIGDPLRLSQIFINLVGNAIKFTDHGEITIKATLKEASEESALIQFEVSDTGIGISKEDQAIIFNAFSQADSSNTRRFSGTGLGLSISKDLCELMGGSIDVVSEQGVGSCFRFTARFLQQVDSVQRIVTESDLTNRYHVLLMDGDATSRAVLKGQLQRVGMRVEAAKNAAEARDATRSAAERDDAFDIMLVDMTSPAANGLDLMRFARSDPRLASTHVVMLTKPGQAVPEAEQYGARQLTKPVQLAEFIGCMNELVSAPPPQLAPPRDAEPISPPSNVAPPPGRQALVVEDHAINLRVAVGILESLGWHCDTARNGLEALAAHEQHHFDVIFMDLQMPEMDGFEATSEIRRREAANATHTPIIALTASAESSFRERCLNAGMDEFVAKPFSRGQIQMALATVTTLAPVS